MTEAEARRGACRHKTALDHIVGRTLEGERIWRCSSCGVTSLWVAGWRYYGNLECRKCSVAVVETVECPGCAREAAG